MVLIVSALIFALLLPRTNGASCLRREDMPSALHAADWLAKRSRDDLPGLIFSLDQQCQFVLKIHATRFCGQLVSTDRICCSHMIHATCTYGVSVFNGRLATLFEIWWITKPNPDQFITFYLHLFFRKRWQSWRSKPFGCWVDFIAFPQLPVCRQLYCQDAENGACLPMEAAWAEGSECGENKVSEVYSMGRFDRYTVTWMRFAATYIGIG